MAEFFRQNRIAVFSDLHIGVHRDSTMWHKIAMDYCDWMVAQLEGNDIQDIVFCGDFFHDRNEVELTSLNCGVNFLKKLSNYNVTMITGNHDCFYKDKSVVNSLRPFKEWGNVKIFDELTTIKSNGKTITFCPWGTTLEEVPDSDILFGHFEIQNFKMNCFKICDHGEQTANLLDKSPFIVSGHFHFRDHRKYTVGKSLGEILYLGSPFELDWGDKAQSKGLTLLTLDTMEVELIENNITPKHIQIRLSDILQKKNLAEYHQIIPGNIISFVIDKKITDHNIDLILTKFTNLKPLQIKTEFNIFDAEFSLKEDMEKACIDVDTALSEFINLLNINANVDRKDIYNKCSELYKVSLSINHE